jgi:transcription initiation factor TFIID TATA-box-binding protein
MCQWCCMTTDYKVVNMVAGTRLTDSIDLYSVSATLDVPYEAEQFPGMVYRVSPETHGPTAPTLCLLLFSSGKCVATGAKAYEDVETAMSLIHEDLSDNGFSMWPFDPADIEVSNIVITTDYGNNLSLRNLVLSLPFDRSEYEPEQFPGLIYRLSETAGVCLIFSSGKCVITGTSSLDEAEEAVGELRAELDSYI